MKSIYSALMLTGALLFCSTWIFDAHMDAQLEEERQMKQEQKLERLSSGVLRT